MLSSGRGLLCVEPLHIAICYYYLNVSSHFRRRRSLLGTGDVLRHVHSYTTQLNSTSSWVELRRYKWAFMFCFFSDATTQQWLDGFWPNLHQRRLCVVIRSWWYPKIGPLKNFWELKTSIFGGKFQTLPSSDGCCAKMRINSGKSKTIGITRVSRLPSHLCLVKVG